MNSRIEKILKEMVPIGIIGKTHGLAGELRFFPFTNIPEILEDLDEVFLYNEKKDRGFFLKIEGMRIGPKSLLVKFKEFDDKETSKVLEGFKVYIKREDLPELEDDEYYFEEIYDCEVLEDGKNIGKVVDIIETGSNWVLVVKSEEGEEKLVPMIKDYVKDVDIDDKIIKIKKMEWI